jgi:hypothetical protein
MSATRPVQDFICRYCGADPGQSCVTAGGALRDPHRERWNSKRVFTGSGTWVVRLLADDPRFGLSEGDELLVRLYPYDAKVTVIRRISDGFDPECNQYMQAVEYVRADTEEVVR